ncbi:STAS domain-containing protein [Microbispora bryophytorum]|uniref:Anti-sigma factor antagonist n=1 Tax=Microbispora bryophytorum subsp. camponoti TaxID=1677852 RepID=A0ABR8L9T3_9ACTN|nr:STAS domain-containing protein [Microbispora camponoti]MBD3147678.1 STAS domain-containing protein [Microbispora camponoti]
MGLVHLRVVVGGHCTVVRVAGEIGFRDADLVETRVAAAWAAGGAAHLVVDLSEVPICDSAGRAALVRLLLRVRRTGGRLVLAGVAPRLARHLHVAGLLGWFEVCGTADEAVARVREPYGGERGEQG